jgi:hypothetical protein
MSLALSKPTPCEELSLPVIRNNTSFLLTGYTSRKQQKTLLWSAIIVPLRCEKDSSASSTWLQELHRTGHPPSKPRQLVPVSMTTQRDSS